MTDCGESTVCFDGTVLCGEGTAGDIRITITA